MTHTVCEHVTVVYVLCRFFKVKSHRWRIEIKTNVNRRLTIRRVSKVRLFILDLLLCDHSCISGDIALRIQHDASPRHTKTSKPGHPRFLTSRRRILNNLHAL